MLTNTITQKHIPEQQETYMLDSTQQQKIGNTTYIVSSFLKPQSSITFLQILKSLIENEIKESA